MTDELTRCFVCDAEIPATSRVCPECGAVLRSHTPWPAWHGTPEGGHRRRTGWRRDEQQVEGPPAAIETLALDPTLVDVHPGRPGQRRALLVLAISGGAWALAGLPYEVGDPANWWDIMWYAAGALTLVLAVGLLVALIRRTRSHGFRPALRWLVS